MLCSFYPLHNSATVSSPEKLSILEIVAASFLCEKCYVADQPPFGLIFPPKTLPFIALDFHHGPSVAGTSEEAAHQLTHVLSLFRVRAAVSSVGRLSVVEASYLYQLWGCIITKKPTSSSIVIGPRIIAYREQLLSRVS